MVKPYQLYTVRSTFGYACRRERKRTNVEGFLLHQVSSCQDVSEYEGSRLETQKVSNLILLRAFESRQFLILVPILSRCLLASKKLLKP